MVGRGSPSAVVSPVALFHQYDVPVRGSATSVHDAETGRSALDLASGAGFEGTGCDAGAASVSRTSRGAARRWGVHHGRRDGRADVVSHGMMMCGEGGRQGPTRALPRRRGRRRGRPRGRAPRGRSRDGAEHRLSVRAADSDARADPSAPDHVSPRRRGVVKRRCSFFRSPTAKLVSASTISGRG